MPDTTRTNDPNIVVESYAPGRVVYRDLTTGERWVELGECNRCGLCMSPDDPTVEWVGTKVGEPGACRDRDYETRPLYAVRPRFEVWARREAERLGVTGCSLTFEVLGD